MVVYTVDSSKGNEVLLRDLVLRKAAVQLYMLMLTRVLLNIFSAHGSAEVL
jgi:hypothetical protein